MAMPSHSSMARLLTKVMLTMTVVVVLQPATLHAYGYAIVAPGTRTHASRHGARPPLAPTLSPLSSHSLSPNAMHPRARAVRRGPGRVGAVTLTMAVAGSDTPGMYGGYPT